MTQLPEAELLRKDLEKDVVNKRVKDVTVKSAAFVARHRTRPEFAKALAGRKIETVARRGTLLVFELDEGDALVVRLGPHGTISRESATAEASKATQMVATFTTGGAMHVVDPDKSGEAFVVGLAERDDVAELSPKGIDPLNDTFTWTALNAQLKARNAPLKELLLDDDFVVGLGDLYSDEILWASGLSGRRLSGALSAQEVRRLYRAVQEVLHEAIKQGGAETVEETEEDEAEYHDFVKVYDREGLPCARCRQPVQKETFAGGHVSFYCANCQT